MRDPNRGEVTAPLWVDRLRRGGIARNVFLGIGAISVISFLTVRQVVLRRQQPTKAIDRAETVTLPDTYWVHAALGDDFNDGVVWIRRDDWWGRLHGLRRIARIARRNSGKHIYCEALWADDRYLERWIETFETRQDLLSRPPDQAGRPTVRLSERLKKIDAFRVALWKYRIGNQLEPPLIFIGQWHRRRLGITLKSAYKPDAQYDRHDLEIEFGRFPMSVFWQFRAGVEHPQIVVVLQTALAAIGLGIGFIGLGLGLIAFVNALWAVGTVLIVLGTVLLVLGTAPLVSRARVTTR